MAHHCQLKGGSLLMVKYSGLTNTQMSFYVYDIKSKVVAYCWYASKIDDAKFEAANLQGKILRHQAGVGNKITHYKSHLILSISKTRYAHFPLREKDRVTEGLQTF